MEKYLGEDTENDNEKFDLLLWWKVNTHRFPILSKVTQDVLPVPISIVASESTFSAERQVLDVLEVLYLKK